MTLYPSLLEAQWDHLAPELRDLHGRLPSALEGRLEISGATGIAGRWMRRLAGMPTWNGQVEGRLVVQAADDMETWDRSFGPWCWRSLQGRDGRRLVERFGRWCFRFRLRLDRGGLVFEPDGVILCLGRLELPLPGLLAPRVVGHERVIDGSGDVEVRVEVRAPGGWKVLKYAGRLRKVEP